MANITKYSGDTARIEAEPDLTNPDELSERQIAQRLGLACPVDPVDEGRERRRLHNRRERQRAYYQVGQAVKHGDLADLKAETVACVDCGERATVYDHRDYRKPLEVAPVCVSCNVERGHGAGTFKVDWDREEWAEDQDGPIDDGEWVSCRPPSQRHYSRRYE